MKTVALPSGEQVPAFGMGAWNIGDRRADRGEEIATLRLGLDLGAKLIDTAEMYGDGRSEELVGEAVASRRDEVFLVSKVYPHNASRKGIPLACERSLQRLKTDRIDLYLLHWKGSIPFAETIEAFAALQKAGKIRHYGVSNLDLADMQALAEVPGGKAIAANQLLYNLTRRGIEWNLLPWLRAKRVPVMAYSPLGGDKNLLVRDPTLAKIGATHGCTAAAVALAWVIRGGHVIAIPEAGTPEHVRANAAALSVSLAPEELRMLESAFPAR